MDGLQWFAGSRYSNLLKSWPLLWIEKGYWLELVAFIHQKQPNHFQARTEEVKILLEVFSELI